MSSAFHAYRDRPGFGASLEVLLSALYHRIVRPGDTVIDGGANGGLHTIPLARLVGPNGHIYAYEPQPGPMESLASWLGGERLKRQVTLRQVALARTAGRTTFFQNLSDDGLSSRRRMNDDESAWRPVEIESVRLDDEPIKGRCTFIKLDLEGGEFDALRGASGLISRDRPTIAMEHGFHWAAERFGYDFHDFLRFFDDLDYTVIDFMGETVSADNYTDQALVWEMIALPATSALLPMVRETIEEFVSRHPSVPEAENWSQVMAWVQSPKTSGYWK